MSNEIEPTLSRPTKHTHTHTHKFICIILIRHEWLLPTNVCDRHIHEAKMIAQSYIRSHAIVFLIK